MKPTFILLFILFLLFGLYLLYKYFQRRKRLGVLKGKIVYQDHTETITDVLYSKRYPLKGKPDYLTSENGKIIPVEYKNTKKTPSRPYDSHVMQLVAYCMLVEELYESTPPFGYLKYNDREFKVQYTPERKQAVLAIIKEIQELKRTGREPKCDHPYHN